MASKQHCDKFIGKTVFVRLKDGTTMAGVLYDGRLASWHMSGYVICRQYVSEREIKEIIPIDKMDGTRKESENA